MVCGPKPYDRKTSLSAAKNMCIRIICSFILMAAFNAYADTVNYFLDNVNLDDNKQMTGTFSWTYGAGDFENGVGQFTSLVIPHTSHDQTDLNISIDIGKTIEITLIGNFHDDGVDISLVLSQALTPTTSSPLDLNQSKYDIGGNGFFAGLFLSGHISPITGGEVVFEDGFETKQAVFRYTLSHRVTIRYHAQSGHWV